MTSPRTLNEIFFGAIDRYPAASVAMRAKIGGTWTDFDYRLVLDQVQCLAAGLTGKDLEAALAVLEVLLQAGGDRTCDGRWIAGIEKGPCGVAFIGKRGQPVHAHDVKANAGAERFLFENLE